MIKVYHKEESDFFSETTPEEFPKGFDHVATVKTDNLSDAYRLTNHIDQAWWKNPEVALIKESRSTSVGDVFVNVTTGVKYKIDKIGVTEFE